MIIYDYLAKKGGPAGYLYNLRDSERLKMISRGIVVNTNKKEKKFKRLRKYIKDLKHFLKIERKHNKFKSFFHENKESINNAQINHFHSSINYYECNKYLNNDSIKILTTHSPQPTYLELKDSLLQEGISKKIIDKRISKQREIDIFSLNDADYVVFPCKEALSPYEEFFDEINFDYSKLRYVLTGVEPLEFKQSKEDFFSKYNIDKNKKIISYIGRKNLIKGFDRFLDIAKEFEGNEQILFVCAGVGMETPDRENILDIGWTTDPGAIINASDFVLVPNRDTYFDINMIQILSIGTPVITTLTGGNRWFNKFSDINMFYFENSSNLKSLIEEKINNDYDLNTNKNFYEEYFTTKIFEDNYVKLYDQLIKEN